MEKKGKFPWERAKIGPAAKELSRYLEEGEQDFNLRSLRDFFAEKTRALLAEYNLEPNESDTRDSLQKLERYILLAVVIPDIMDRITASTDGYNLEKVLGNGPEHPFEAVRKDFYTFFNGVIDTYFEDILAAEDGRSKRMQSILELLEENLTSKKIDINKKCPLGRERISQGFGTARLVMLRTAGAIPLVMERDVPDALRNTDAYMKLFDGTYPILLKLAMVILSRIFYVQTDMLCDSNKAAAEYRIMGNADSMKLRCTEKFLEDYPRLAFAGGPNIGCPALVNLDGGSPIKKIFDWIKKLIRQIYEHYEASGGELEYGSFITPFPPRLH